MAKFEKCIVDAIKNGQLKIVASPDQEREKLKESGFLSTHGSYSPKTNTLTLHRSSDERVTASSVAVLAHEITHWFFDEDPEGGRGLFYHEGFQGPSWEEVSAYCQKKVQEPQFSGILAHIDFRKELELTMMIINSKIGSKLHNLGRVKDTMNTINEDMKSDEDLIKSLSKKEKENILTRVKSVHFQLLKVTDIVRDLSLVLKEAGKKGQSITLADILELRGAVTVFEKRMIPYQGLLDEAKILREYYAKVMDAADEKKTSDEVRGFETVLDKTKAEIAQEKDGEKKAALEKRFAALKSNLDSMKKYTEPLKNLRQQMLEHEKILWNLEGLTESLGAGLKTVISLANMSNLEKILGDPQEIIARIVDSLYKIHITPVEQNRFPLNEGDLKFLSRFTFQGKMIFKKAIEKYRLALAMRKAGFTPHEITEKLEYASRFENNEWPGTPWKFNMPIQEQVGPIVPTVPGK